MNAESGLAGLKIVSFESRKSAVFGQMLRKQGAVCIEAPTMQEIPLEKNQEAFQFAEKLFAGEVDILLYLTGVGASHLTEVLSARYGRDKVLAALAIPVTVARGPKPQRVLNELGLPIAVRVPEPNTWREVLQQMAEHPETGNLTGKRVAVQEYGVTNLRLIEALKNKGAKVLRVPVYRWALPDDLLPLKKAIQLILEGEADATVFTNATQVHHLLRVAADEGCEDALREAIRKTVVVSVGPVCTEALEAARLEPDLEPEHPTLGGLVVDMAKSLKETLHKKRSGLSPVTVILPSDRDADRGCVPAVLRESLLMKALRREPVERVPVWLMRQAGRYMKEYRDIRKKVSFIDFCRNPELSASITIRAQELLGADAAIIFSDILLLIERMGLGLEYSREEGPAIQVTLEEGMSIDSLREFDSRAELGFVLEAIRVARRGLKQNIPLLGFAGAPFTLASYMIEGGTSKSFTRTKAFMYADPGRWRVLMQKLSRQIGGYLIEQFDAGVQAVQLFDSWVGCLGPEDYREFVLPYSAEVIRAAETRGPVIHFGTGNPALLTSLSEAGGCAVGVDFRIGLGDAWKVIGERKAVQGNLDPVVLCASREIIRARIDSVLNEAAGRPGHIFNLGHGILPDTPVENAQFLVDYVHQATVRSRTSS